MIARTWNRGIYSLALLLATTLLASCSGSSKDSATFDADGTAHITRIVPMPSTASPEAQKWLESLTRKNFGAQSLAERRASTDKWRAEGSADARKHFPANVEGKIIAGVRTDIITPLEMPEVNRGRVFINLHGGGFVTDSGSLIEGLPIANLTKTKVVSIYYRLAPENLFPAAVDDVVAVYKKLLKEYKPQSIGIFGTSAGGILTAEVAVRLKQLGEPLPGALGLFSILADFSRPADSQNIFTLDGLPGDMSPSHPGETHDGPYIGNTDPKDPVLSPIFADLHGMPPTLLVTSTRDFLLSNTALFHLALLRAGNDARLLVYEALPHAFWYHFQLPETQDALEQMAKFLDERVVAGKTSGKAAPPTKSPS
ncbi:MAG TPA: alpha/beta hydrolase [Verrucomicrobiae bacterium]|nr:alpha/beta hydrolase [Verrucomicrobiae bacterium]